MPAELDQEVENKSPERGSSSDSSRAGRSLLDDVEFKPLAKSGDSRSDDRSGDDGKTGDGKSGDGKPAGGKPEDSKGSESGHLDVSPISDVINALSFNSALGDSAAPAISPETKSESRTDQGWLSRAENWVFGDDHHEQSAGTRTESATVPPGDAGSAPPNQGDNASAPPADDRSWFTRASDYLFGTGGDTPLTADSRTAADAGGDQSFFGRAADYFFSTRNEGSLYDDVHDLMFGDGGERSILGSAWDAATSGWDWATSGVGSTLDGAWNWVSGETSDLLGWGDSSLNSGSSGWDSLWDWGSDVWNWASDGLGDAWDWATDGLGDAWDWLSDEGDDLLKGFGESWSETKEAQADISSELQEAAPALSNVSGGDVDVSDVAALQDAYADIQAIGASSDNPAIKAQVDSILLALSQKIWQAQTDVEADYHEGNYGDAASQQAMNQSSADITGQGTLSDGDRALLQQSYERMSAIYNQKDDPDYLNVLHSMEQLMNAGAKPGSDPVANSGANPSSDPGSKPGSKVDAGVEPQVA